MNIRSYCCRVLCTIASLFLLSQILVAQPVQLGEPVGLAALNEKDAKRIKSLDGKLVELDRRIRLHAAHINQIASAIEAGRSKEQIVSVINNQPSSAGEDSFRTAPPRTDTQRMHSKSVTDQKTTQKPRENRPLVIERSFSAALLKLARTLASDIQRKDELLDARGEILLGGSELTRQDMDRTMR